MQQTYGDRPQLRETDLVQSIRGNCSIYAETSMSPEHPSVIRFGGYHAQNKIDVEYNKGGGGFKKKKKNTKDLALNSESKPKELVLYIA